MLSTIQDAVCCLFVVCVALFWGGPFGRCFLSPACSPCSSQTELNARRALASAHWPLPRHLRKTSKTYGKTYGIILSEKNYLSLYIPEGFAHAYYSFSPENIIYYKLSNYYQPKFEDGILWNDQTLKVKWPNKKPIVSKKDKKLRSFLNFKKTYRSL